MKTNQPYIEEFNIEAVQQLTQLRHKVAEVSARIGVSQHSLYKSIKAYGQSADLRQSQPSQAEELRRVTEARHPKKGRRVLCLAVRVRCAFIKAHED